MPLEPIGVRDLKNKATQVVRSVREHGTAYVITVAGQPVAVLRPFTPEDEGAQRREALLQDLEALDALALEAAEAWSSPKTGLEILSAVRDESW
ncbi:hypothetical protein DCC79_12455 [bacterium]|mgnify:CR=1 FL=1|nr:type II toxin-antitoxin system prevent-host-death family antitoxin [Chloroflexi bacterium CFX6]RIL08948.1 MAG: hypothetical protein DCC79_12455 [bacterium]